MKTRLPILIGVALIALPLVPRAASAVFASPWSETFGDDGDDAGDFGDTILF